MRRLTVLLVASLALAACGPSASDVIDDRTALATYDKLAPAAGKEGLSYEAVEGPAVGNMSMGSDVPEERVEKKSPADSMTSLDPSLAEEVIAGSAGTAIARNSPERHQSESSIIPASSESSEGFSCSARKTCPMMRSCKEAYYHLNQCGDSARDRDGDGVPCENIC